MSSDTLKADDIEESTLIDWAEDSVLGFTQVCKPDYRADRFHIELAKILQKFFEREIPYKKLLICTPPQHGKSTLSSYFFPAWVLGKDPTTRIICASYSFDNAKGWSKKTRNLIRNRPVYSNVFPQTRVHPKNRATKQWLTDDGGFYMAAGVDGGISGKSCDLGIIDDPIRGWNDAQSPTIREKTDMWYKSQFIPRIQKDSLQMLIQTRWHPDDLAGRLLEREGDEWAKIIFPAFDEEERPLAPGRYDKKDLLEKKEEVGTRVWMCEYQQRPVRDSKMFDMDQFTVIPEQRVPDGLAWVRAWDLAFTKGRASSRLASVRIARHPEKDFYYLSGLIYGKWNWSPNDTLVGKQSGKEFVKETIKEEMCRNVFGAGGLQKNEINTIQEELEGDVPKSLIDTIEEREEKISRAANWSNKAEAGKFFLIKDGSDWDEFKKECHEFPDGSYDDMVDAVSTGYLEVGTDADNQNFVAPISVSGKSKQW